MSDRSTALRWIRPGVGRCTARCISAGALTAALLSMSGMMVARAQSPPAVTATASQSLTLLSEEVRKRGGRGVSPLALEQAVRDSTYGDSLSRRTLALDSTKLSHEEQLTRGIIQWEAWKLTQQPKLYWFYFPINPSYWGNNLQPVRNAASAQRFSTSRDVETYLHLLDSTAVMLDSIMMKTRAQTARGIILPRGQADVLIPYYQPLTQMTGDNPFVVAPERLASLPAAEAEAARQQIAQRLTTVLIPRFAAIVAYIDREIRQRGPADVGIAQYPGGKEAYRVMLKIETSLPNITPEQVYQRGLETVAALDAEMKLLRDSLGFKGTKAEFREQLQRDPRFYEKTPEAVGARLMTYIRKIEPIIPRYFSHTPKAPYGAKRLDPSLEATMTFGLYSRPTGSDSTGYYIFNGSKLNERSLVTAGALIYHELVPGHHFQIMLALENDSLPQLRRSVGYSGFGEGWGEYASSVVAREAGMYADPYDRYGRLLNDMMFAVRIVVDPGMSYFGWTRDRAMNYMRDNLILGDAEVDSETWRFAVRFPGQATTYRMGRDFILELRRKAERELGPRFDIRRFHDAVIGSGPLPLFILQRHIDWWIAQEKSRAPA